MTPVLGNTLNNDAISSRAEGKSSGEKPVSAAMVGVHKLLCWGARRLLAAVLKA